MRNFWICLFVLMLMTSIWAEDGWQQSQPSGTIPDGRIGHSMVYLNGKAYIFGGSSTTSRVELNDLFAYNIDNGEWEAILPSNPPPARKGHSAVAYNNKMYVLFGENSSGYLNDVWVYDAAAKTWTQKTAATASARAYQSATLIDNTVIFFGGRNATEVFKDTWSYNLDTATWEPKAAMEWSPTFGHSAITYNNKMYTFGGGNLEYLYSDMWEFDPASNKWKYVDGNAPNPRTNHVMVSQGEKVWISGGTAENGSDLSETWECDLSSKTWTKKTDGPTYSKAAAAMLGEDRALNMLLFGGQKDGTILNQTWKYYPTSTPPTPPPPVVDQLVNQIGALGKGRFMMYVMKFEEDQAKVKVDMEWAQDKAKLKLFALRVPRMFKGKHPFMDMDGNWEMAGLKDMKHFQEIRVEPTKVRGNQTISVTFSNVRRGHLMLFVHHSYFSPSARDIQLKISEMTTLPRNIVYVFPIGDPDKKGQTQNNFVKLPKTPVRWHSRYPHGTDGQENTEVVQGVWKWSFADKTSHLKFFPKHQCVDIRFAISFLKQKPI